MEFNFHQQFWNISTGFANVIIKNQDGKKEEITEEYKYITPLYVCDICQTYDGKTWAYGSVVDKSKPENEDKFISVRCPINDVHTSNGDKFSYHVFKTKQEAIEVYKKEYPKSRRLRFKDIAERSSYFYNENMLIITD